MEHNFQSIPVKLLCEVIDLLNPSMDNYLYLYDTVNDFFYISPHAVNRFPISDNAFYHVLENLEKLVFPPDFQSLRDDINAILTTQKSEHNLQYRWMDRDYQPVWINCRGYVVRENGKPLYMMGCINEIGDKRKADNISGFLGETSLKAFLGDIQKVSPNGFVLRLGLDDFKIINENLGIEYGNKILRETAECINRCIKKHQTVYRAVADEFIILDFSENDLEKASSLYKSIRHAVDESVKANHYEAVYTISGGILSCSDIHPDSPDVLYSDLMKLSEFALNEAKRQGKNRFYVFSEQDYAQFLKRRRLTQTLRRAVNNNFEGFEAYFQPLYLMDSHTLYGAETLMRFHCEEFGNVSPAEFIPILEATGLIIPAGQWILHQALIACRQFKQHIPDFKISINVSYVQIMKSDIIDEILSAVSKYQISPSNVIIELTESGLLENNLHFSSLWSKLRAQGILLALDDFGTGYSNFHYLYNLSPNIIKIDRSFTLQALTNTYDYNLLSLMSSMAHELNLKLCIEGIETEAELERIAGLHSDYSQGYYWGRPCPLSQFLETFFPG